MKKKKQKKRLKQLDPKLQAWIAARKLHRLSHAQVQMARELGMSPSSLGGLDNHDQEPWKGPLPEYIEHLYKKRFGKELPNKVMTIEAKAQQAAAKKARRREEKQRRRQVLEAQVQKDRIPQPPVGRGALLRFLRAHRLAVQASVASDGGPQAAVIGYAITDDLEIVFDTVESSRKYTNLQSDPRVALVVGWDLESTAQLEAKVDFPSGTELERLQHCYFEVFPEGRDRQSWPGITYIRARPHWVRYSDFSKDPPYIVELDHAALIG